MDRFNLLFLVSFTSSTTATYTEKINNFHHRYTRSTRLFLRWRLSASIVKILCHALVHILSYIGHDFFHLCFINIINYILYLSSILRAYLYRYCREAKIPIVRADAAQSHGACSSTNVPTYTHIIYRYILSFGAYYNILTRKSFVYVIHGV